MNLNFDVLRPIFEYYANAANINAYEIALVAKRVPQKLNLHDFGPVCFNRGGLPVYPDV